MTKEVLVSITGNQGAVGDDETVEVKLPGEYYKRNDTEYIKYDQYDEDSREMIHNTIKIKDGTVELKKTGPTNARMYFKKDASFTSYYDLPQMALLMETKTSEVLISTTDTEIHCEIVYDLYINQQYVSDCNVKIHVTAKEAC